MATIAKALETLREAALSYPDAYEDHPWGDTVFKVAGKIFLFMGPWEGGLGFSVKLPRSFEFALEYPFTKPAGYNLGRARWVECRFERGEKVPLPVLTAWLDESYRAVAPRRLVKALPAPDAS